MALRWRSTNTSPLRLKTLHAGKRTPQTRPSAQHFMPNPRALPAQTSGALPRGHDDFTISSTLRCPTPAHASLLSLMMRLCLMVARLPANLTTLLQVFVNCRERWSLSCPGRAGRSSSDGTFGCSAMSRRVVQEFFALECVSHSRLECMGAARANPKGASRVDAGSFFGSEKKKSNGRLRGGSGMQ